MPVYGRYKYAYVLCKMNFSHHKKRLQQNVNKQHVSYKCLQKFTINHVMDNIIWDTRQEISLYGIFGRMLRLKIRIMKNLPRGTAGKCLNILSNGIMISFECYYETM